MDSVVQTGGRPSASQMRVQKGEHARLSMCAPKGPSAGQGQSGGVLVAQSNDPHGVTHDAKGRLISGVKTLRTAKTIDNDGRLYVATGAGVEILSSQGGTSAQSQ